MVTKICFKCGTNLPLSEYYKHQQMGDGHLNKCKTCTKADSKNRRELLIATDPTWVEKEAERQRQKEKKRYYEVLKGTTYLQEKRKKSSTKYKQKYPEKYHAKNASDLIPCEKGHHRHHWSYTKENWKDVIMINEQDHFFIHRYMRYDRDSKCYKTLDGTLLDSRIKHETYITNVLKLKSH